MTLRFLTTKEVKKIYQELKPLKLRVEPVQCPECGKLYIPTPKSPDKCLICKRHEK